VTVTGLYWITYLALDPANGSLTDHGSITLEIAPPCTESDVFKLGDVIADISRERGILPEGRRVLVQSWSKMGG
jgi:hypothetical protein